jgi:tRNA (guanine37-N1)-methyltransferase
VGVPEVLLSGDHAKIARFRRREALRATRERRPELLQKAELTREDARLVQEIENEERAGGPAALYKNPALIHK